MKLFDAMLISIAMTTGWVVSGLLFSSCENKTDLVRTSPIATPYIARPHFSPLDPMPTSTVVVSPTPSPTESPCPTPEEDIIYCNNKHTKILLCHIPSDNPSDKDLKCLKVDKAMWHLHHHPLDFLIVDEDTAEGCTEE